jgi:hypothetical protein
MNAPHKIKKEDISMKASDLSNRVVRLETIIEHIHLSLERIEKRFDELEKNINIRFDKIEQRLDKSENHIWINFYFMLTTIIGLSGTLGAIMAKGFGWFK